MQISGITYQPRQDMPNGRIKDYQVYVSLDGTNRASPVAQGSFDSTLALKQVPFVKTVRCRYVRFVGLSEVNGDQFASIAELGIMTE